MLRGQVRRRCRLPGRRGVRIHGRAPTLCLVRGVYTTRVHTMFPLAVADIPGKAQSGRNSPGIRRTFVERAPAACDFSVGADG